MVGKSLVEEKAREEVERQGYNVAEAARIIGIGRTTMHKLLNQGRLRPIKIGSRTIIPRSEIDRLLNGTDDTRAA